jgi:hypothetical protein
MPDLEINEDNFALNNTNLWFSDRSVAEPFPHDYVLKILPQPLDRATDDYPGLLDVSHPIDALRVIGSGPGGAGVAAQGDVSVRAVGDSVGLFATLSTGPSTNPNNFPGSAILGSAEGTGGVGVRGLTGSGSGIAGTASDKDGIGVLGESRHERDIKAQEPLDVSVGVLGSSDTTTGVLGRSKTGVGLSGKSEYVAVEAEAGKSGIGAIGSGGFIGVAGLTADPYHGVAVFGAVFQPPQSKTYNPDEFAGFFVGPVNISGPFTVINGAKSAAAPHPDGSHRLLYCVEAPDSWFEDFGEAELTKGRAEVRLDPDFAALIVRSHYHVFLTPYGDSRGLWVSRRTSKGFEVREQGGGKSGVRFSYRIVAKRRDIAVERLAKFVPPTPPDLPNLSIKAGRRSGRSHSRSKRKA